MTKRCQKDFFSSNLLKSGVSLDSMYPFGDEKFEHSTALGNPCPLKWLHISSYYMINRRSSTGLARLSSRLSLEHSLGRGATL